LLIQWANVTPDEQIPLSVRGRRGAGWPAGRLLGFREYWASSDKVARAEGAGSLRNSAKELVRREGSNLRPTDPKSRRADNADHQQPQPAVG
jgi:hypothetical protein